MEKNLVTWFYPILFHFPPIYPCPFNHIDGQESAVLAGGHVLTSIATALDEYIQFKQINHGYHVPNHLKANPMVE